MDKRVKYKDLVIGAKYFDVHVGRIEEIVISRIISSEKFLIWYKKSNFLREAFMADFGIVDCPKSYNNQYNCLFVSKKDAMEHIKTEDYKSKLAKKKHEDDRWLFF